MKVGDRITAVAQGTAEFADVRDMRLDKVVEMIRGKKGTKVRLLVIPADAPDPSKRKTIELVRDEIKLKDQEARADIIIKKDENGEPVKLGWITLPFVLRRHGEAPEEHDQRCARAAEAAEERRTSLGWWLILRRNGGGSLEEAISLTGLVFEIGPDRANEGLEWKHRGLERSRSGHRLRRAAGRPDQPAKRVGQ